jgi:hypothetical protein
MDYCLLEDAFKDQTIGCKDTIHTEKALKHERKKQKKQNKQLNSSFDPKATDPDRPALVAKNYSEAFQNEVENTLPNNIANNIKNNNSNKNNSSKLPSYFTQNNDSDDDNNMLEGFTSMFSPVDDSSKTVSKADGSVLPTPSLNDNWKPLTPSKNTTAFFKSLPSPGGTYPLWNNVKQEPRPFPSGSTTNNDKLQEKIDDLMKRLDELEKQYTYKPNNQHEILAFVGTGIFLIFTLSLLR